MAPKTQTMTGDERRRSKRFAMPLKAEYRTLTRAPLSGQAVAQNISRGGIAFSEMHDLERGITVQLKMNVPGHQLPVFATGRVTWADETNAGVKLTKISRSDEERILEYIYQSWLKQQPQLTAHG